VSRLLGSPSSSRDCGDGNRSPRAGGGVPPAWLAWSRACLLRPVGVLDSTLSLAKSMLGKTVRLLTMCLLFAGCGKTSSNDSSDESGADVTTGETGVGSTVSVASGADTGPVGFGGTSGGSGGAIGSNGGAGGSGTGGSGGSDVPQEQLSVSAWPLNLSERCLEGGSTAFLALEVTCAGGYSIQRDANGQCWLVSGRCEVEGLSLDSRCSGTAFEESPPLCSGEGGAGGS
jgi:hypothetical protein